MPEWKPPAKLKPINAEAYAGLRQYIEAGVKITEAYDKRLAEGCTQDCGIKGKPSISEIATILYDYIPAASIPLAEGLDDSDRTSIETFRVGRAVLLQALDDATPIEVLEKFGDADPEGLGTEWWAVALSAAGVLAWLGKKSWRGALLARIGAGLLGWLVAAGVIQELGEGAKQILDKGVDTVKDTLGALPYVAGGALVLGIVFLVVRSSSQKPAPPRLPAAS